MTSLSHVYNIDTATEVWGEDDNAADADQSGSATDPNQPDADSNANPPLILSSTSPLHLDEIDEAADAWGDDDDTPECRNDPDVSSATADAEPSGNLSLPSTSHKHDIDTAAEAWGDVDADDSGNDTNVSNLMLMPSHNLNFHHLDRFKVNIKSPLMPML